MLKRINTFLDSLEATISIPIRTNHVAVIFAYWLGQNGEDGTHIICFTVRISTDETRAVVNNLDGTTSTITATPITNGVRLDLTNLTKWGYSFIYRINCN